MSVYLDSSALVKLLVEEDETPALRRFLASASAVRVTSALARTEVVRAVGPFGAVDAARRLLRGLHDVPISRSILDDAGDLAVDLGVRSLDAIHLATARSLADHLEVLVTYDRRLLSGAAVLDLPAVAPA